LLRISVARAFFAEWIDSFYARDIQELFGIRNRVGFMKLFNLLFETERQPDGLYESVRFKRYESSYVKAHIEAMSIAHAVFLLPPFHGAGEER